MLQRSARNLEASTAVSAHAHLVEVSLHSALFVESVNVGGFTPTQEFVDVPTIRGASGGT